MKYLFWSLCFCVLAMACGSQETTQTAQETPAPKAKPVAAKKATTATATKGAVKWLSMEEAMKLNEKEPKGLIVDVYTEWCGPCKMMDRLTFNNPEVAALMNDYYPVKFNAESPGEITFQGKTYKNPTYKPEIPKNRRNGRHELVGKFAVRGYPTLVVLDEKLNVKKNLVGFKKPEQLVPELKAL